MDDKGMTIWTQYILKKHYTIFSNLNESNKICIYVYIVV